MEVPRQWCGKNLIELQIREKYNLNVIGIKYGDTVSVKIDPNEKLRDDEILIVVGENTDLEKFKK